MAQLKNITINDTGSLVLPVGTTGQQPLSPTIGMVRYNSTIDQVEFYNGSAWKIISDSFPEATGGTIADVDISGIPYRVHYFTTVGSSTFSVIQGGEIEYLIVAGGGGGGVCFGGGGGAGGLLTGTLTVTPQSYTITVGASGTNQVNVGGNGGPGGNSSAFGFTAIGGGFGGGNCGGAGGSGGSGGGGSSTGSVSGAAGTGTSGQGNNGAVSPNGLYTDFGGGGGGAGSAAIGALGGVGISSNISGSNIFYAGGGRGSRNTNPPEPGGIGGGGAGGVALPARVADGITNTGGGGGGSIISGSTGVSGLGGTGVVIVRYRRNTDVETPANRTDTSSLPNGSVTNASRQIISTVMLRAYLDAGNRQSYSGTGTSWFDLSGNGFTGTLLDGPVFSPQSLGNFVFDGVNDRVHLANPSSRWAWTPTSFGNNTLSFEMWVRSTDTDGRFLSRPWNGSGQYNYWITPTSWWTGVGTGDHDLTFSNTLSTGQWEYICAIVTPTQKAVYRNGVLAAPFTNHGLSGATPSSGDAGLDLALMTLYPYVGGWGGVTGFSIQGQLGIFRAYDRVLSAEEIFQHYNAEKWRYGI
jgi:hypothetical protein